jgi:hypothetical protein
MTRTHLKILGGAVLLAATAVPAFAEVLQDPKPTLGRSEEAKKNDAAFDAQYRARGESSQTEVKADPWGGVRTPTQPTNTTAKKPAKTN